MDNLGKRERQRIDRCQQILECSLDMIISRGYEAMKIRDIAEKLSISTGLFFNYFESKKKIYEELVKIALSGPAGLIEMNTPEIEPIYLFEKMTEAIFKSLKSFSMTAKLLLLVIQTMKSETAPDSVKRLLKGFDSISPFLDTVKKGQELGQIKQGDPIALISAYWSAVSGIAETYAFDPCTPLPESGWIVDILRAR